MNATELAQAHWNNAPLYFSEEERYRDYPWLYEAAEFRHHMGERVLEIGCGSGCELLQFAKNGAIALEWTLLSLFPQAWARLETAG